VIFGALHRASWSKSSVASRLCDRLAVGVLVGVGIIASLGFRDYGLSWDDYTHAQYGELLLQFYASGFHDQRALSWVNLYYYGGGFDLAAAAAAKGLPFSLFETRRLVGAAVGILGLFVTWRVGRRIGGPPAGLLALILLAVCPIYYGHMFMNPKDAPFAVAMAILLLASVRAIEEYPRPSLVSTLLLALGLGLAFGSRVMGAFGAIEAMAALTLVVAAEARAQGLASAGLRLLQFCGRLFPALVLGYALMGLVWPWGVADPLNPFRALEYFSHFFEKPWSELFDGEVIRVTDMPRSYVPTMFALTLPEIFLALGLAGAGWALWKVCSPAVAAKRRAILLLLALAALLPPAVTIALHPATYNGIRHFIFVLPPLAVLGGMAGARMIEAARVVSFGPIGVAALVAVGLIFPIIEMKRLHPYEYTYFNNASGGVRHARDRYMLDYWGLSLKQASQGLLQTLASARANKPAERPWKIAVCGPHRSPQVELGQDFKTSWDPNGADFAMTLGEFYCMQFDAPLIVEVKRGGVTYARVYDIRGRSYDTVLTLPGL
jgi:hypothetical protein